MKKITLILLLFNSIVFGQSSYVTRNLPIPINPAPNYLFGTADFQHDGFPELVSTDQLTGDLIVYPNTNGLIDSIPVKYPTAKGQYFIVDWNHDSWMDLVYSSQYDGDSLHIMINNSGAGFLPSATLRTSVPITVQINYGMTDLNGDQYPDVYFVDSGILKIVLNNSGSFLATSQNTALNVGTEPFTFGDFNNDNLMDVVNINGQYAIIYQNLGSFNYSIADTVNFSNINGNHYCLAVKDLNIDGIPEILMTTDWEMYIAGKTTGWQYDQFYTANFHFQEVGNPVLSSYRGFSDFKDVDGNGYDDFIIGNSVFFVYPGLTITRADILAQPDYYNPFIIAMDSNHDNIMELWWNLDEYYFNGNTSVYSENFSSGTSFSTKQVRWNPVYLINTGANNPLRDFDGDGDLDFIFLSPGRMMMAVNDGTGHYSERVLFNDYMLPFYIMDVDNDGLPDLIASLHTSSNYYYIFHNDGNLQFTLQAGAIMNGNYSYGVDVDFNNDGYNDLICFNTNNSNYFKLQLFQNFNGTITSQGTIYSHAPYSPSGQLLIYAKELNQDNLKDVAFYYGNGVIGTGGRVGVLFNQGNLSFNTVFEQLMGNSSLDYLSGCAEITGDGRPDLIMTALNGTHYYYPSNSTGYGWNINLALQDTFSQCVTTDANADGSEDLVAFYYDESFIKVLENTGTGFGQGVLNPSQPISGNNPYQVDYDADGDTDLLIPNTNIVLENTTFSSSRIIGNVFYDNNGNGIQDPGEMDVENFPVKTNPSAVFASTNATGRFSMKTGSAFGTYYIESASPFNGSFSFTTNPYPDSATISSTTSVDSVSIGFRAPGGIHQAMLDASLSQHRCLESARVWLNTVNLSPIASNYRLELSLPATVSYLASSLPPSSVNGNQYHWNYSASAFETENLTIDVMMPGPQFSGDTLYFISILTSIQGNDSVSVVDTLPAVLTCSFDPNEKLIIPLSSQIGVRDTVNLFDDYIEYQVNFQNTGNDTARDVRIQDNLDVRFDPTTVKLIAASDPVDISIDSNGHLTATFENIYLPDSTVDQLGSMGFLKFSVRLQPSNTHNYFVTNTASIIFDQNPAILTEPCLFRRVDCKDIGIPIITAGDYCTLNNYVSVFSTNGFNASYQWSLNSNIISNVDTAILNFPQTGTYNLQITVDLPQCHSDSIFSFNVTHTAPTVVLQSNISTHQDICPGGVLHISTNNVGSRWYNHGILVDSTSMFYNGHAGDSISVFYIDPASPHCSNSAYTVIFNRYELPLPLLVDTSANLLGYVHGCDYDTVDYYSTIQNAIWTWSNSTIHDTDTTGYFRIWYDPAITNGSLTLQFDSMGCHHSETYSIRSAGNSLSLRVDTGNHLINCPPFPGFIYFYSSQVDSVHEFQDTVLLRSMRTGFTNPLPDTGFYSYIGFRYGCEFASVILHIRNSESPFADIHAGNNMLYTSDGTDQTWYFSTYGSSGWLNLGTTDTIYSPTEGFYYLIEFNADSCRKTSDIYLFDPTNISSLSQVSFLVTYNQTSSTLTFPDGCSDGEVQLFNETGQLAYQGNINQQVQLPALDAGVYILKIQMTTGFYTQKIIVLN